MTFVYRLQDPLDSIGFCIHRSPSVEPKAKEIYRSSRLPEMEKRLRDIENHYLEAERKRRDNEQKSREEQLVIYVDSYVPRDLWRMTDKVWDRYISEAKRIHERKIAAKEEAVKQGLAWQIKQEREFRRQAEDEARSDWLEREQYQEPSKATKAGIGNIARGVASIFRRRKS